MNYIKMSPIVGMSGYGGGATALPFSGGAAASPWGDRGIMGGGQNSNDQNELMSEYINIASAGNSSDFGNLTVARYTIGACSDSSRAVFCGGKTDSQTDKEEMDYYTVSTTSNASDFGNMSQAGDGIACTADINARGIMQGGTYYSPSSGGQISWAEIYYFNIANATGGSMGSTFGDATQNRAQHGECTDGVYAVWAGASYAETSNNIMDYVTIQTTGNAQDFGDLISGRSALSGAGNATRGVFAGGWGDKEDMEYITIASAGNASEFGNMHTSAYRYASMTNGTRAVWAGGNGDGGGDPKINNIQYIAIDTTGNGSDFGDLSDQRGSWQGASGNA